MSEAMLDVDMVMLRYGYSRAKAQAAIADAVALSETGLDDIDVAMEMIYRMDNPGEQRFDTRENGWRYISTA